MPSTFNASPFINAVRHICQDGVSAVALNTQELFYLANMHCIALYRVDYAAYWHFVASLAEDGTHRPDYPNGDVLQRIHDALQGQVVAQKQKLYVAVANGDANWRRYTWLLDKAERRERDLARKKDSLAKAAAKELAAQAKTAQKKAPQPLPVLEAIAQPAPDETPAPAPTITVENPISETPVATPETTQIAEPEPHQTVQPAEPEPPKAPTLKEKWQNRFRPDWPLDLEGTQEIFITLEELRALEEEIAAEAAEGLANPYAKLAYHSPVALHNDGFFVFRSNGPNLLPTVYHYKDAALKTRIKDIMGAQREREWIWSEERMKRKIAARKHKGTGFYELPKPQALAQKLEELE